MSCTFADATVAADGAPSQATERDTSAGSPRPRPMDEVRRGAALYAFAARALEQHLPAPTAVTGASVGLGAPDAGLHVVVCDVPHALAVEAATTAHRLGLTRHRVAD